MLLGIGLGSKLTQTCMLARFRAAYRPHIAAVHVSAKGRGKQHSNPDVPAHEAQQKHRRPSARSGSPEVDDDDYVQYEHHAHPTIEPTRSLVRHQQSSVRLVFRSPDQADYCNDHPLALPSAHAMH